jgi:transcriptional regulator with XRE-family HTH domain
MAKRRIDPIDQMVGKLIKRRRLQLGYSQQQLAEAVGVTFQQVQKYERGTNRVSAGKLYSIAQMLKTNVSFFFSQIEVEGSEYHLPEWQIDAVAESQELYGANATVEQVQDLVAAFNRIPNKRLRQSVLDLCRNLSSVE